MKAKHFEGSSEPLLVGVDLGGTKTLVMVAAHDGSVLAAHSFPNGGATGAVLVEHVVRSVTQAVGPGGVVAAIGLGIAGAVTGTADGLDRAPNLRGLDLAALSTQLELRFSAPVQVDNDVNAAALGERVAGHASGSDDFVFVAVGTGIGMGAVVNGRLLRGARHAAGEIGYMPIGADPFVPAHRIRGPLEEVVSGPSIESAYSARTGTALASTDVFARVDSDPAAADVVHRAIRHLGIALGAVRAVLDPSLVVLGGGIGSRPDVRTWTIAVLDDLGEGDLRVETTRLGPTATARGAVELARTAVASAALRTPEPALRKKTS
jgi:predicted NBD/HSP70 family sugar kinase